MIKSAARIPRPRKEDLTSDEDQYLDLKFKFKKVKPEPIYVQGRQLDYANKIFLYIYMLISPVVKNNNKTNILFIRS